jgi:hypothetical protein
MMSQSNDVAAVQDRKISHGLTPYIADTHFYASWVNTATQ